MERNHIHFVSRKGSRCQADYNCDYCANRHLDGDEVVRVDGRDDTRPEVAHPAARTWEDGVKGEADHAEKETTEKPPKYALV